MSKSRADVFSMYSSGTLKRTAAEYDIQQALQTAEYNAQLIVVDTRA
jgi:hypothetical protein